jgi:AraC family transcriptional regulator
MSDIQSTDLLRTPLVRVRDVCCAGRCRHHAPTEVSQGTHLVYAYRGLFGRLVADVEELADANQLVYFNHAQEYSISHPVAGGDDCLSISLAPELLHEMGGRLLEPDKPVPTFRRQRQRIAPTVQRQLAQLRLWALGGALEPLAAEALVIAITAASVNGGVPSGGAVTPVRRRVVDRIKRTLAGDPLRRWTLSDIAAAVGGSPLHLTQLFQQAEGLSLYRYQLQLRLAQALVRLPHCDDLTALALDLGFSSHSHFSAAFRKAYGCAPSTLQHKRASPKWASHSR